MSEEKKHYVFAVIFVKVEKKNHEPNAIVVDQSLKYGYVTNLEWVELISTDKTNKTCTIVRNEDDKTTHTVPMHHVFDPREDVVVD